MKTCSRCKETKSFDHFYKRSERDTYRSFCKSCSSPSQRPKNFHHSYWKERFSSEELELFSCLKTLCTKAKLRNQEFDKTVDWEYLFNIWSDQNGLCAYSKVPLSTVGGNPHKVSLDRIDSSLGYLRGNLQLVSASVNRMKQEFDEDFFLDMCNRIADNN